MMSGLKRVRGAWFACGAGLLALVILAMPAAAAPGAGGVAELVGGGANLEWRPLVDYRGLVLTVSGPDGATRRVEVGAGESPTLSLYDAAGQALPDGQYTWELRVTPQVDPGVRRQLGAARRSGDDAAVEALRQSGKLLEGGVQSGTFRVAQGSFTIPEERAEPAPAGPRRATASGVKNITAADQVIPDDLIVQGSICVGFDCVNNESFGFDTIRLKENNTRIKFDDTSVGSFPSRDWQLTANDSASGGANKFSIEDITGARVPFTITAGAATNSIFVDSTGRVGFRTATPVLDLHIATSNTPGIRLEQNSSGGFTAQTWDIAGNEANFFVRDVTGGSRLPFRIRPGAPTSSLDINADGDVGIGTASPANRLDIQCSVAGAACGRIGNANATGFSGWEFEDEGGTVVANFSVDNAANTFRLNAIGSHPLAILTESAERLRVTSAGSVGIGTTAPASRLHVNGGDIRVTGGSFIDDGTTLNVPDYVFEPGYQLMPIDQLAQFVRVQKHLPNVPNEAAVKANGVNLGQFSMRLLEKVEELTLYTLSQEEQLATLRNQNAALQERLSALEVVLLQQQ